MLRSVFGSLYRSAGSSTRYPFAMTAQRSFAQKIRVSAPVHENWRPEPVAREDMPFLHHGKRPRYTNREKFIMPRKRANKMMLEITNEAIEKSRAARPEVFESGFKVGDAIEVEQMQEGSLEMKKTEKYRGVVMGIFRRRLDESVLIRELLILFRVEKFAA